MKILDEMWTALAAYQPQADADGHGESWAKMCGEKTLSAADDATYYAAYAGAAYAGAAYAGAAANVAAAAAAAAAAAEKHAQRAIDIINKAKEKNTCRITNHK